MPAQGRDPDEGEDPPERGQEEDLLQEGECHSVEKYRGHSQTDQVS